jgi:hypothetical protein
MARQYSSNASTTTLNSGVTSSDLTFSLKPFTGWILSASPSSPMTIIVDPDTASEEVCTVTGISGTSVTVLRGVDGTSAQAHNAGAVVKHGVSARDFAEPANHIDNVTSAHGLTIANVTTLSNTQVFTNKSIDATSNTLTNIGNSAIAAAAAIVPTKISGTAVTQADTGTVTSTMIADGTIVNADINASAAIATSKLAANTVTVGSTSVALGGTAATVSGLTLASPTITTGVTGTGIISNTNLANSSVTVGSTAVALGGTAATVAGLTLTSPVLNTPTLSGTVAGTASLTGTTLTSSTVNGATLDAASTIGGISGTTIAADHGAWNPYTPLISGTGWSATTSIPTNCRYLLVGKTCFINYKIKWPSNTSAGAGFLSISLPYSARKVGTGLDMETPIFILGWYDSSTYNYPLSGLAYVPSTLTNYVLPTYIGPFSSAWLSGGITANSYITISGSYEVA